MTKDQFERCFQLAASPISLLPYAAGDLFDGCGLPEFKKVTASPLAVAELIRWQCQCIKGGWDEEALNEMREICRHKIELADTDVQYVDAQGNPVETRNCIVPDNHITTFVVKVRGMRAVTAQMVKDTLEQRYEVVEIEPLAQVVVVRT